VTVLLFALFAGVAVVAAIAMVFQRSPVYSCLCIVLSFFGLAGLYILLGAPFIAAIQIIVYAGAIMVLFLFVIMLLNLPHGMREPSRRPRLLPFAVTLAVLLLIELVLVFRPLKATTAPLGHATETSVEEIGVRLFTDYLYPFELSSVLILAAIVGAVILAKRRI